ncbi:MAG: phosphate signaling complex protein PhoU [Oscillospiraceae bacterium]|jgi:phosphate transport system protein|nr:phosphate signaling complex protein PhoU [Oscillospiraceae bacterium]
MRSTFDKQLQTLNTQLIEMGMLVETAIAASVEALKKQDVQLAKKAIASDAEVDQKEKDIETLCLKLLLQQQPVAKDLRLISAALKMITDMERIGDQAADIAEISIYLSGQPAVKKLEHIPQMAEATAKMVTESIDAFVKKDLALARQVIDYDDIVDALFDAIKSDLIELIGADSANGGRAIDLIMIAKYLERIGDHAVNIAEWVVFSITGKHVGATETEGE